MFYVYILYSQAKDKFYVGQTNNLENRIERHNSGYVKSTKSYRPWKVVYNEKYEERAMAVRRENQIKGWKSKSMIKELVEVNRDAFGREGSIPSPGTKTSSKFGEVFSFIEKKASK